MAGKNSDSIKVAIKVRPLLPKEKECLWKVTGNSIQPIGGPGEPYYFDFIFDQKATNQMIFEKMGKNVVHSVIKGFNGTIFAYGQTSSGKTYTMMGDEENPGVMIMAVKEIFKEIQKAKDRQFLLRVGYIEIYNEKLCDLLNKKNTDLKIHENNGIVSVNCEEVIILNEDDVLYNLNMGNKERTVGETQMNEHSSRSHAIFRIIIESRKIDRTEEDSVTQSVLNLVDLAGSERADQTGARGSRLKEGAHINKSLLFLGTVIKRLSENDPEYISYRDSKLTRILQASLGGNALTSIICTIKPNALEETQSTLSFAMRAKVIKNKPMVNETVSDATMMKRLEKEIKELKAKLDEERKKNESQNKIGDLEMLLKRENLKIITCNTLLTQRDKRRRTWGGPDKGPDSTNLNADRKPSISRLPKPRAYLTPMITLKPPKEEYESSEMNSGFPSDLPQPLIEDEEFVSGELCSFSSGVFKTPNAKSSASKTCLQTSITPKAPSENFEEAYLELQEFTNLEKNLGVEHEVYEALKKQLDEVIKRNEQLEKDRHELILVKDELLSTKERLEETEHRSKYLQIDISRLESTQSENVGLIEKYDEELKKSKEELKSYEQRLKILEIENQQAVSYEFELESYKNKAKLREADLIHFIDERNQEIEKLEATINKLIEEKNQQSKEQLTQQVKSATSSGTETDTNIEICIKCQDLRQILDKNKQIELDFDKLSLNYKELENQLNHANILIQKSQVKIIELEETNQKEKEQVQDTFYNEIAVLKDSLEKLQKDNDRIACDNKEKTAIYMELEISLTNAKEEMRMLRTQYEDLQKSWETQQQTIESMKNAYNIIDKKYQQLLKDYEKSAVDSERSQEVCNRLETENSNIQTDIEELKQRVQEAQNSLLVDNNRCDNKGEEDLKNLEQTIINLKRDLIESKKQYDDLQQDFDVLSNQLMESIQENDSLKKTYSIMQEQFEKIQDETKKTIKTNENENNISTPIESVVVEKENITLEAINGQQLEDLKAQIVFLQKEIKTKDHVLKATESNILALQKQMTDLQAELLEKSIYVEKCEKMRSQIELLEKEKNEISMDFDELQGKFENITFDGTNISLNNTNENNESLFEQVDMSQTKLDNYIYRSVLNEFEDLKTFFFNMKKDFMDPELFKDDDNDEEEYLEFLPSLEQKLLISENDQLIQNLPNKEAKPPLIKLMFRKSCNDLKEGFIESLKIQSKYKAKFEKFKKDLEISLKNNEELLKQNQIKIDEMQNACSEKQSLYESELKKLKEALQQSTEQNEKLLYLEAKLEEKENHIKTLSDDYEKKIQELNNQYENHSQLNQNELDNIRLGFFQKLQESEDQFRENINKVKDEWEQEKESYTNSINNLKKLLNDSEMKMKSLTEQLKQEEELNKNEEYENLLKAYNKLSEDYNTFKEISSSEKESLESLLKEVESNYKQAEHEKEIIQTKLNQEILELQEKDIEYRQYLTSVEETCNQLESKYREYEENVEEAKLSLNEKLRNCEEEIDTLKISLQCTENERDTLLDQLGKLLQLFTEVNSFKNLPDNDQNDLLKQFQFFENSITQLKDNLENIHNTHKKIPEAFIDLVKNLQSIFKNVEQNMSYEMKATEYLQQCLKEKEKELDASEKEVLNIRKTINDIQNELKIIENIKIKNPNLGENNETFPNISQDLENLKNYFQIMKKENEKLKDDNTELLANKSIMIKKWEEDLEEFKKQIIELEGTKKYYEELKSTFADMQFENLQRIQECEETNEDLQKYKDNFLQIEEAFKKMEKENEKLKDDNAQLLANKSKMIELQNEMRMKTKKLEEDLDSKKLELQKDKNYIAEITKILEELKENQINLQDSKIQLEKLKINYLNLEETNEKLSDLESKFSKLLKTHKDVELKHLELQKVTNDLEMENSQLKENNKKLQEFKKKFFQLEEANKEFEKMKASFVQVQEENLHHIEEFEIKILDLEEANEDLLKYKDNFLKLNEAFKEMENKLIKLNDENEQLQKLKTNNQRLEKDLKELQESSSKLYEENLLLQDISKSFQQLQQINKDLEEFKIDYEKKYKQLQEENVQLKQYEINFLQLQKTNQDLEKFKEDFLQLQKSYKELEMKSLELSERNSKMQEIIISREPLLDALEELQGKCYQLEEENKEISELKERNLRLEKDIKQIPELKAKSNQLNEAKVKLEDLETQCMMLKNENQELIENKIRSSTLNEENKKILRDQMMLKVTLHKYEEDVKRLQKIKVRHDELVEETKLFEEQIESLQEENSSFISQLELLKSSKNNLLAFNAELQESLNASNEAKNMLEKRLKDICDAESDRNKDIEDLREQINQQSIEKEGLYRTIVTLTEKNQLIAQVERELRIDNSKLVKTNELLNSQYEASKKLQEETEMKLHSAQKKFETDTNNEIIRLKDALEEAVKKLHKYALNEELLKVVKNDLADLIKKETQLLQENDLLTKQNKCMKLKFEEDRSLWEKEKEKFQTTFEDLQSKVESLEKANQNLKNSLESQLSDQNILQERLNDTITCLMEEKKTLEEKIFVLEEMLKRSCGKDPLSSSFNKTESGNSSFDSITSDRSSLSPRRKTTAMKHSEGRRHQRLSIHDDNRRKSYFNPAQDVGTMTDPIDQSCKCSELDEKLRECKKNLFIKESQVTALNMELKNHPLKSENVALQKRFQEEQEKHRNEIKRCHQKLAGYREKVTELTSLLANTTPEVSAERKITVLANAETQTEFEEDMDLKKLQTKYEELKVLVRHRANTIRELEEKLSQNENHNGSNQLSAVENGQLNAYKTKYDSLKNELKTLQKKYELAKQVLYIRKEEICRLQGGSKPTESEENLPQ